VTMDSYGGQLEVGVDGIDSHNVPLERLAPHSLFNRITGMFPVIIVDTRSLEKIGACCLRDSFAHPMESNFDVTESILRALHSRPRLGPSCLVFVDEDGDSDSQLVRLLTEQCFGTTGGFGARSPPDPVLKRLYSISFLAGGFSAFHMSYTRCPTLFVDRAGALGDGAVASRLQQKLRAYPSEIVANRLFLGDQRQAVDEDVLRHLGITHIVDATEGRKSAAAAAAVGAAHMHVNVPDCVSADISRFFESTGAFIAAALHGPSPGRVFVHCRAGISRSTSLVLAYLLRAGLCGGLREGFEGVLCQRPFVCPNKSFRDQLRRYEHSLWLERNAEGDAGAGAGDGGGDGYAASYSCDAEIEQAMSRHLAWMVTTTSENIDDFLTLKGAEDAAGIYKDDALLAAAGAFAPAKVAAEIACKPKRTFLKRKPLPPAPPPKPTAASFTAALGSSCRPAASHDGGIVSRSDLEQLARRSLLNRSKDAIPAHVVASVLQKGEMSSQPSASMDPQNATDSSV
jgi:protein-tyrosine phosphatase